MNLIAGWWHYSTNAEAPSPIGRKLIGFGLPLLLAASLIAALITGSSADSSPSGIRSLAPTSANRSVGGSSGIATGPKTAPAQAPSFQIVYTQAGKRFDGGKNLYVLIPAADLTNIRFQDDVKSIIRLLVKESGRKISVDIFDDAQALDLFYKQYGDLSLKRSLSPQEEEQQAIHAIAGFSGQLSTGIYRNTLYWFPSAFKDNPTVGRFVRIVEFNP